MNLNQLRKAIRSFYKGRDRHKMDYIQVMVHVHGGETDLVSPIYGVEIVNDQLFLMVAADDPKNTRTWGEVLRDETD